MHSQQNSSQLDSRTECIIPQLIKPVHALTLLQKPHLKISKTKKICTLGPKSATVEQLVKLMDNGMNVARLNFSHGNHQSHAKFIQVIKQARKLRPNRHLAILLDTKGPQIRTGKNIYSKQIQLKKGQQLQITIDYDHISTSERISCSYSQLPESVKAGSQILFSDGKISSIVKRVDQQNKIVTVEVLNDGTLGEKKNMCLPGCIVNLPTINPYDQDDIVNFGLKHRVDFIAVSFARYRTDIQHIRKILGRVRIISKIQNHQALQNLDQIIDASDGVMVARGDLGMETPLQKIILLQKLITTKCLNAGKFVIVATQMLQSMQSKPRPTRAEVSDITNAILDLADCIMTSGQTANGQFPEEATQYMNKIAIQTEKVCDYQTSYKSRINTALKPLHPEALKLVDHAFAKNVDVIFLKTSQIQLINLVSSYRPEAYIFVFTKSQQQIKCLTSLNYGVYVFDESFYLKPQQLLKSIQQDFGFQDKLTILTSQLQGNMFLCHTKQLSL